MATVVPPIVIGTRPNNSSGIAAMLGALSGKKDRAVEAARRKAVADSLSGSLQSGQPNALQPNQTVVDAAGAAARAAAVGATPSEAQTIAEIVTKTNARARAQNTERVLRASGFKLPQGFHTADSETRTQLVAEQFGIRSTSRTDDEQRREAEVLMKSLEATDPALARGLRRAGLGTTSPETFGKILTQAGQDRRTKATIEAANERARLRRKASKDDIRLRNKLRTTESKRLEARAEKQSNKALDAARKTKLLTVDEAEGLKGSTAAGIRDAIASARQRRSNLFQLKEKGKIEHNRAVNFAAANVDVLGDRAFALLADGNATVEAVKSMIAELRRKAATELKRRKSESDAQKLLRVSGLFDDGQIKDSAGMSLPAAKALVNDRRARVKQVGSVARFDQEVDAVLADHNLEDNPANRSRAVNVVTGRTDAEQYFNIEYGNRLPSGEFILPEDEQRKVKHRLAMGESETALLAGRTDRRTLFQEIVVRVNDYIENARMIDARTWAVLPTTEELEGTAQSLVHNPKSRALIERLSTKLGMSRIAAGEYLMRLYIDGTASRQIRAARDMLVRRRDDLTSDGFEGTL